MRGHARNDYNPARSKGSESYMAKLRDPRWQKKRLEVLQRDEWTCQICRATENTLHVHHRLYGRGFEPWEYPGLFLVTLCESCHERETRDLELVAGMIPRRFMALFFSGEMKEISDALSAHMNSMEKGKRHIIDPNFASVIAAVIADPDVFEAALDAYAKKTGGS